MSGLLAEGSCWTIAPRRDRRPEDIEHLLAWAYAVQKVDLMLGRGLTDQEAGMDGDRVGGGSSLAWLEGIARLGCRIDKGGMVTSAPVHPDAATIHNAVMSLDRPIAWLVMDHARSRTRPCSGAGVRPTYRWLRGRKGNPLVLYTPEDVGRNYGWSPIEWTLDRREIETRRATYALWRRALVMIGIELLRTNDLLDVTPTGPAAPRPPQAALDFTHSA